MEASEPDWESLIEAAAAARPAAVAVTRHVDPVLPPTATRPQKMKCGDDLYCVKFKQNMHGDGKGIFTEQVMALLGELLGAPVPRVDLVDVPEAIAADLQRFRGQANSQMQLDFDPVAGTHHGSLWAEGYGGRADIAYQDKNLTSFGSLHVLYTWAGQGGDHQFIYQDDEPHAVLSVDHTAFFGGSPPTWDAASLDAATGDVVADPKLDAMKLDQTTHEPALDRLSKIKPSDLARVVARAPDEWGVGFVERKALASYLYRRMEGVADLLATEKEST